MIPFNVVMENMMGLTAQAQNELCIVRRELQKYKTLKLTPEQQTYLDNFVSFLINNAQMKRIKYFIRNNDPLFIGQNYREERDSRNED